MNASHQALKRSLRRMAGLPVIVVAAMALSWSVEAKPVFKPVERGDCECWCKTSAGTYTHVEFGITQKACTRIQSAKSCTDGQGNQGKWHGCAFYGNSSTGAAFETADPYPDEVLQVVPRVVPQDLPTATFAE
jgi:hypothetical protein